jgi:hypothetical protein
MPSAEYDLRYLQAGIEQLERYLLSNDIYWTLGVRAAANEPPYPQMTLGWLLLSRQRLLATAHSPEHQAQFTRLEGEMETIRSRWRIAWEKKACAELSARLKMWRDFLEDYRRDAEENYKRYAYEVGKRILIELLSEQAGDVSKTEQEMLAGLDSIHRAIFQRGSFIWEAELEKSFPQARFWYLYGRLPARNPA